MVDFKQKYNLKCPGVKRLMREAIELAEATEDYHARPLEDNLFEWHFTIQGPKATEFENGVYHGRILLPKEYPMQPPNIILLTPNGRFETNKKICLSISGYHPETWQPSWSIRTALLALIAFMPTPSERTIGSLDYTPAERKILAKKSRTWECPHCGVTALLLSQNNASKPLTDEEKTVISQIALKGSDNTPTEPSESAASNNQEEILNEENEMEEVLEDVEAVRDQRHPMDTLRDILVACIVIMVAIVFYRRSATPGSRGAYNIHNMDVEDDIIL